MTGMPRSPSDRPGAGLAPAADHEAGERDAAGPGEHHAVVSGDAAATVRQPVKDDNESHVRDYSRCILCYKCVEGCGEDARLSPRPLPPLPEGSSARGQPAIRWYTWPRPCACSCTCSGRKLASNQDVRAGVHGMRRALLGDSQT